MKFMVWCEGVLVILAGIELSGKGQLGWTVAWAGLLLGWILLGAGLAVTAWVRGSIGRFTAPPPPRPRAGAPANTMAPAAPAKDRV